MPLSSPSQSSPHRLATGVWSTACNRARRRSALACSALLLCGLLGGTPSVLAQDSRDRGDEDDRSEPAPSDYVELFDPDRQDPEDVDGSEPPMAEVDEVIDRPQSGLGDDPAWWRPEPPPIPDRVLAAGDSRDPRTVELFYYGCSDRDQRRDVTLFANGTLRQRRGPWKDQDLQLEEMGQAELRRHVVRLMKIRADVDFPSQFELEGDVGGAWVDHCRVALDLPDMGTTELEFGGLSTLPLPLQQLVGFAEELATFTRPLAQPENLPKDYRPDRGEVLRTRYGSAFRVRGYTSDGGAVELERLDGATIIYVPVEELDDYFVAIEPDLRG